MRTQGKITFWNEEKGFGFITPSTGAKQVFVHITAFRNRNENPAIDQIVQFSLSSDKQGRPCAIRVTRAGESLPGEIKRNDRMLMILSAVVFLVIVVLSAFADLLPVYVLVFYLTVSAFTFLVYAWDKTAARKEVRRISEVNLHGLSLIGGWPGAMIAQQQLRHKSAKQEFRSVFWATVVINLAVFIWLYTDSGSAMLRSLVG